MTSFTILNATLVLHICGIVLWAGGTVIDFFAYQKFWKLYGEDKSSARSVYQLLTVFAKLISRGAALVLLTGIIMMIVTKGVFGSQRWFHIKMILLLLGIFNALLVWKKASVRVGHLLGNDLKDTVSNQHVQKIKTKLRRYHYTQLLIFFLIFILSVFKFN